MNQPAVCTLMRASGAVSLLLLTMVSALGHRHGQPLAPRPRAALRHPRAASQRLPARRRVPVRARDHAIVDPDAAVRLAAVVLPMPSSKYGLWLGLAALAFDLIVALVVTSLLRHRTRPAASGAACTGRVSRLAVRAAARRGHGHRLRVAVDARDRCGLRRTLRHRRGAARPDAPPAATKHLAPRLRSAP